MLTLREFTYWYALKVGVFKIRVFLRLILLPFEDDVVLIPICVPVDADLERIYVLVCFCDGSFQNTRFSSSFVLLPFEDHLVLMPIGVPVDADLCHY